MLFALNEEKAVENLDLSDSDPSISFGNLASSAIRLDRLDYLMTLSDLWPGEKVRLIISSSWLSYLDKDFFDFG